ncbi:MAG: type II CAAX endopeptidase family protein [Bacteroidales bacterium]
MKSKQSQNHYYPNIFEALVIIAIFIFLSIIFGTMMTGGIGAGNKSMQDIIALLGYILTAGGTLLLIIQFKRVKTPAEKTFRNSHYSFRTGTIIVILSVLLIIAIDPLTELIPVSDYFRDILDRMYSETIPAFLTAVIVAPVMEELIFRGIMLEGLLKNYNPLKAIILTNLLFGVAHLNPWQFAGAFLMGLFISWVYWRTRSIQLAIVIHFINNLVSYTAILITSKSPADISIKTFLENEAVYYSLALVSLVIVIITVVFENRIMHWKK